MEDPRRLSEVFVELADTLVSEFDLVDFMGVLADRCVELMHATEVGVLLADAGDRLHSVAASHETAHLLELYELQNDAGPCLDSYRSGAPIINHSLESSDQPWPSFASEARRHGFSMVHGLPMRLRGRTIGALAIFDERASQLSASEAAVAQALADVATIGLLQQRSLREAVRLSEQLQSALTSRVVIEQAKGMLAERLGVSMQVAFELLRTHSHRSGRKLAEIARLLLAGGIDSSEFGHPDD